MSDYRNTCDPHPMRRIPASAVREGRPYTLFTRPLRGRNVIQISHSRDASQQCPRGRIPWCRAGEIVMHRVRMLAVVAMVAVATIGPSAVAASALGRPADLHLIRGGGGRGGGFGGHGGGFHGGYVARGGFGYRRWGGGYGVGVYPYAYGCPYPYSYPYCTFPNW
jgi:hypothetical protein